MRTDPRALAATHHDLLIVGGGIHGLFIAYDAATRGMSVALVEQADFGSGLSFNHQRTIHGGLREIGRGRISKARRQMFERRRWAQMAPHLIRPVPFVLGASGWTVHSRAALAAGLRAYEWVGRSSQSGVPRGLRLPRARLLSAVEMQRMFPDMPRLGGGALWHDYQTRFPDRLNFTVAMAAAGSGARLANYAPAVAPLMERGRVAGARVRDLVSGDTVDVTASVTLLAAGSGLAGLASTFGVPDTPPFVRAMNMLLDRPAPTAAFAATGPSGRVLTIVPWHGYALVGTYQSDGAVDTAETAPPSTVIDEMVAHVNATFPALTVRREDIRLVHHGLAPAEAVGGRLELKADAAVVRCAEHGAPGLLAVIGVKFTSARAVA